MPGLVCAETCSCTRHAPWRRRRARRELRVVLQAVVSPAGRDPVLAEEGQGAVVDAVGVGAVDDEHGPVLEVSDRDPPGV